MDAKTLKVLLRDTPVSEVRYYSETGSTNDIALQWLDSGAPDFALVAADRQTAGRGRMQRQWITNPGAALAFSIILHLDKAEVPFAGMMPFIAGASVCSALEKLFSLTPQVKWPNDILLSGDKAAGILVESTWKDADHVSVVAGIGVNIALASLPPSNGMTLPATCVENAVGYPVDRWELLAAILSNYGQWRSAIGKEELISFLLPRLAYKGEQVRILHNFSVDLHGTIAGIDQTGALLIETQAGITPIDIGDVQLRLLNN